MELLYYPDPRLRVEAAAAPAEADEAFRRAVAEMFRVMYKARGVGLAGPQAGIGRRVIVANLLADPQKSGGEQAFLDPEILEKIGEVREEEGCLSFPGMTAMIVRAEKVVVRYRDLEGETVKRPAEGLEAKLFQHEIDHLDGVLLVDRMTPADRKQWAPLLKELEKEFKSKSRKTRAAPSRAAF